MSQGEVVTTEIERARRDWMAEHLRSYLESGGAQGHIVDLRVIGGHQFTTTLLLRICYSLLTAVGSSLLVTRAQPNGASDGIVPPILHLTFFHPLDDHYGLAPIEAEFRHDFPRDVRNDRRFGCVTHLIPRVEPVPTR